MLEPSHRVVRDIFDVESGERQFTVGQRVKAVDMGECYYVWGVPFDAMRKPAKLEPWLVGQHMACLEGVVADHG